MLEALERLSNNTTFTLKKKTFIRRKRPKL